MDKPDRSGYFAGILKSSLMYYSGEMLSRVFVFFLYIFAARVLGPSDFGLLSVIVVSVSFGLILSDFGYTLFFLKRISAEGKESARTLASDILNVRIGTAVLLVSMYVVVSVLVDESAYTRTLVILYVIAQAIIFYPQMVGIYFRSQNKVVLESTVKVIGSLLYVGVGLWLIVIEEMGLHGFMLAVICGSVTQLLLSLVFSRIHRVGLYDIQSVTRLLRPRLIFETVRGALPFGFLALVVTISYRVDTIMLTAIAGNVETGLYNAAVKILDVCLLLPAAVSAVTLGPLSKALARNALAEAKKNVEVLIRYLVMAGVFGALIILVFRDFVIHAVFAGGGFSESGSMLGILIWSIVPVFASSVTSTVISASSKPQVNVFLAITMVVFNVTGNLFLIRWYGGEGAAIATVATESLGLIMGIIYITRSIVKLEIRKIFSGSLLALAIALGAYFYLPDVAAGFLPIGVFVVCLFLFREIRPDQFRMIFSLARERSGREENG